MPFHVSVEGTEFIYFAADDELGVLKKSKPDLLTVNDSKLWDEVIIPQMEDFRPAIFDLSVFKATYFLHWDDNTNLLNLDKIVKNRSYEDSDFLNSIKTQFDRTRCFNCQWEGYTLVVPTGDPYPGARNLDDIKRRLRLSREGFLRCPVCEESLRQLIVKIFHSELI